MPLAVAVRKNILNIYPTAPTCFLTPTWCGESVFAHGMSFSSFQSNNDSMIQIVHSRATTDDPECDEPRNPSKPTLGRGKYLSPQNFALSWSQMRFPEPNLEGMG